MTRALLGTPDEGAKAAVMGFVAKRFGDGFALGLGRVAFGRLLGGFTLKTAAVLSGRIARA